MRLMLAASAAICLGATAANAQLLPLSASTVPRSGVTFALKSTSNGAQTSIPIGSSTNLDAMATSAIATPLLANASVGFYGHMNGIGGVKADGNEASLLSTWAGTGAGTIEGSIDDYAAIMAVTVKNTGSAAISIPIGTIVSSVSGIQYAVVEDDAGSNGWVAGDSGDGSVGSYSIAAGASLTINAECTQIGIAGNLLANQVTQIGVANASITASTLELYVYQMSYGTVTVKNTTSATVNINEGTALTGTNGTYQIGNDPTVSGWKIGAADSSNGYYALAAGASVALPFYSTTAISGSSENALLASMLSANNTATNSITSSSLPSGISIVSSTTITSAGVTSAAQVGRYGGFGPNSGFWTEIGFYAYATQQGYVPTEDNVNVQDNYIWTTLDLTAWQSYVDAARVQGILNLAFMVSGFNAVNFANSTATQYIRAAALYSGGICFDFPPWFAIAQGNVFITATENEIRWANAHGIRSSITLSPKNGADTNFLSDTQTLIARFKADGVMPSQFTVKDGGVYTSANQGNIFSTSYATSLNNVGLWLANNVTLTPTNSEAGLQTRGTTARPDVLMTGVAPTVSVTSTAAFAPYAALQVFAESKTTSVTANVSLASPALGTLSTAGTGTVSATTSYTITGTPAQVTAGLQALKFAASRSGAETLVLTLTDAVGSVVGSTVITTTLAS